MDNYRVDQRLYRSYNYDTVCDVYDFHTLIMTRNQFFDFSHMCALLAAVQDGLGHSAVHVSPAVDAVSALNNAIYMYWEILVAIEFGKMTYIIYKATDQVQKVWCSQVDNMPRLVSH